MKQKQKNKTKSRNMEDLHDKLVSKDGWYAYWHIQKHHQVIHWVVLSLVVILIGSVTIGQIKPDWLRNPESSADISSEMVTFPNDKIAFIIGPQLKSGSSLNPHPWYDKIANERGIFWGDAMPDTPPMKLTGTVSVANGSAIVTGVGTKFLSEIATDRPAPNYDKITFLTGSLGPSHCFSYSGTVRCPAKIASVQSDTQLTLAAPWANPSASGISSDTIYDSNENPSAPDWNFDRYLFNNYYDEALIQYINYYRTGDVRYLSYARETADSYWKLPYSNEGRNRSFDSVTLPPRHASLGGLMLRAMDGRPEMWDWINAYTRHTFNNWLLNRVNNSELYYGVREGAYMLLYATELAKVLPDSYPLTAGGTATNGSVLRAQLLADAENVAINYFGRLQYPDGSWRWNDHDYRDPVDGGYLRGITQPFQIGLLLQALGDLHSLSTNATVKENLKNQITKGVTSLHTGGPYRPGASGYQNYNWRGYHYFYYGGTSTNLTKYANGSDPATTNGSYEIQNERAAISTILHSYGLAYSLTNDSKYRTWGDDVFGAAFGIPPEEYSDGIRGWPDGDVKAYNEFYRTSGRYLAYRLMGSGTVPTPTSNPNPTPPPSPTPTPTQAPNPTPTAGGTGVPTAAITSPANGSTLSGMATVTATASDDGVIDTVYLIVDGTVSGSDTTAPYSFSLDTTKLSDGNHALHVRAWDTTGKAGDSPTVAFNVANSTNPNPTPAPEALLSFSPSAVSFTATANGATPAPKTVTLSNTGNASSPATLSTSHDWCHATPALVASLSPSQSTPVTVSVNAPSNQGEFFCTVIAKRSSTDSDPAVLNVSYSVGQASGDTIAPQASITSPLNGAVVPVKSVMPIMVSASDNSVITKVEFYVNGALNNNCTDTVSPYSCNWKVPGARNKIYRIEARAYDASGNVGRSTIHTVTAR